MIVGCSVASQYRAAPSIAGPAEYFERALAASAAACERPEAIVRRINLGAGRCGVLHFCEDTLENLLFPPLAHQGVANGGTKPQFKILTWDSVHSGVPMRHPPCPAGDYRSRGELASYND